MQSVPEVQPLLSEIDLTRDLSDADRERIAAQCRIVEIPVRHRIRCSEAAGRHLFLIDGHMVRLSGGFKTSLEGYQGLSEPMPLFEHDSSPEDVAISLGDCILLQIPAAALASLQEEGVEVSDIELDATESRFLAELYDLIASNRLELPARPEVALKIQQLTNDPDAGVDQLTEVIQRDGTIAGALLHATNSPLFRAANPILSVRDAVLRLGFRNTRMLTTNLAMRQTFKARHEVTREAMKEVWNEGVLCSAFSYLLSDKLGILHRERALLAGLVSGIGAVPIIQFIEQRDPDPRREAIDNLVRKLRGITGVLVINYWGLGEDLVAVAEHSGGWGYMADEPDYASIAILARWSALQNEGRPHPPAATIPAFAALGVTPPPPGEPIGVLAGSDKELKSLKSMFNL